MQNSGQNPLLEGAQFFSRLVVFVLLFVAISSMLGCGGPSSPNYPASSTQNPVPGITLEQIKITPANSIILLAESRQLFATGIYSDGSSIDISSQVKWSAVNGSGTSGVTVDKSGIATGQAVGQGVVSATVGSITGLLQFFITTNGFTSQTMSILSVPFKSAQIDMGFLPVQTKIQGAYAVQAVNLDADQFASVLPPPAALKASVPMPSGFIPNATAASQANSLVAVISYSSPQVQIIDGSNNPLDLLSNTLVSTFTSPVKHSVTINGLTCMICAAVVNPTNNQLILSTAEGYFTMDMSAGTFTPLPFSPAPAPSANISLNPSAAQPYLLSTVPSAGEVQILDLTTNAVTTYNVSAQPTASAIDIITNYAVIADGITDVQTLADLTNPQSLQTTSAQPLGICSGTAPFMDMISMGVNASSTVLDTVHTLLTSQTGSNCVGLQLWPNQPVQGGLSLANPNLSIPYGYGTMPATPDGNAFVNGNDPNAIATFTSVVDKKDYGILINTDQQWIAKINFSDAGLLGVAAGGSLLPGGYPFNSGLFLADMAGFPIVYLPTPAINFTLSTANIDFGSVTVGTPSPTAIVTLSNIGTGNLTPQIAVQGANPGDFFLDNTCAFTVPTQTGCALNITFTPTAKGSRSASLTVTNSGQPTQTIPLAGTGS